MVEQICETGTVGRPSMQGSKQLAKPGKSECPEEDSGGQGWGRLGASNLLKEGGTGVEAVCPALISTCTCSVTGVCRPVCAQGCVNGSCVEPDHCQCHFGFVGRNCSTECRCNRHSECAGVGARDHCLLCRNHTKVYDLPSSPSGPGLETKTLSLCLEMFVYFFLN